MNSMTWDCDIFKTNTAGMKSFSTKNVYVPSSSLLASPADHLCLRGLFINATVTSSSCATVTGGVGSHSSLHYPCSRYILSSGGKQKDFTPGLSNSSSFSKAVAWRGRHCYHPSWLVFFFFSFLIQSNVFIIILLKMGVFPNSDLALTLCSSVINTASFGSWIASGPFASRDTESDFHTNPGEGRAHMLSLSLWGLVQGKLCDLHEVSSFSGPQFSHFYKRVDFQSSAIFQSSTVPVHFVSTPFWLISPGGKWRYGKSSSFLKVEPLW